MSRGPQVNTEPSCDILCPRSVLLPGPCYAGPRWIQSHLVTFFVLVLLWGSQVNTEPSCDILGSSLSTNRWSMFWGSHVNTEPSCDILLPLTSTSWGTSQACTVTYMYLDLWQWKKTGRTCLSPGIKKCRRLDVLENVKKLSQKIDRWSLTSTQHFIVLFNA